MTGPSYPYSPDDVVETLIDLYRHQGDKVMLALLESAKATIDFVEETNWSDGQQYCYSLQLRVPRKQFAQIEPRIESFQKILLRKLGAAFKDATPHHLTSVAITPLIKRANGAKRNTGAPDAVERIWGEGGFRLFLSHVSGHKKRVANLKACLAIYGVRAFVAHEDIQPTQDWQSEIETALNTMDGMVAILTPEFKDSKWTDQEVGYALGRGIKIVAIKVGLLPYGFLARQQALTADLDKVLLMATGIISILIKDSSTQPKMRDALVGALVGSSCYANTHLIVAQIENIGTITAENAELIRVALKKNSQVSNAFGVPRRLEALLEPYPEKVTVVKDDLPF